jgi:hypothetical protein
MACLSEVYGGKGLSSKEMSEMYKAAGVKEHFKSSVDAEQGTTEQISSILHDQWQSECQVF